MSFFIVIVYIMPYDIVHILYQWFDPCSSLQGRVSALGVWSRVTWQQWVSKGRQHKVVMWYVDKTAACNVLATLLTPFNP